MASSHASPAPGASLETHPVRVTAILDASHSNASDSTDPRHTFGQVRVDGSKGHLELDLEGTLTLKLLGQPTRVFDYPHTRERFAGDCVHAIQRHFVDCLASGALFEATGED